MHPGVGAGAGGGGAGTQGARGSAAGGRHRAGDGAAQARAQGAWAVRGSAAVHPWRTREGVHPTAAFARPDGDVIAVNIMPGAHTGPGGGEWGGGDDGDGGDGAEDPTDTFNFGRTVSAPADVAALILRAEEPRGYGRADLLRGHAATVSVAGYFPGSGRLVTADTAGAVQVWAADSAARGPCGWVCPLQEWQLPRAVPSVVPANDADDGAAGGVRLRAATDDAGGPLPPNMAPWLTFFRKKASDGVDVMRREVVFRELDADPNPKAVCSAVQRSYEVTTGRLLESTRRALAASAPSRTALAHIHPFAFGPRPWFVVFPHWTRPDVISDARLVSIIPRAPAASSATRPRAPRPSSPRRSPRPGTSLLSCPSKPPPPAAAGAGATSQPSSSARGRWCARNTHLALSSQGVPAVLCSHSPTHVSGHTAPPYRALPPAETRGTQGGFPRPQRGVKSPRVLRPAEGAPPGSALSASCPQRPLLSYVVRRPFLHFPHLPSPARLRAHDSRARGAPPSSKSQVDRTGGAQYLYVWVGGPFLCSYSLRTGMRMQEILLPRALPVALALSGLAHVPHRGARPAGVSQSPLPACACVRAWPAFRSGAAASALTSTRQPSLRRRGRQEARAVVPARPGAGAPGGERRRVQRGVPAGYRRGRRRGRGRGKGSTAGSSSGGGAVAGALAAADASAHHVAAASRDLGIWREARSRRCGGFGAVCASGRAVRTADG